MKHLKLRKVKIANLTIKEAINNVWWNNLLPSGDLCFNENYHRMPCSKRPPCK